MVRRAYRNVGGCPKTRAAGQIGPAAAARVFGIKLVARRRRSAISLCLSIDEALQSSALLPVTPFYRRLYGRDPVAPRGRNIHRSFSANWARRNGFFSIPSSGPCRIRPGSA